MLYIGTYNFSYIPIKIVVAEVNDLGDSQTTGMSNNFRLLVEIQYHHLHIGGF